MSSKPPLPYGFKARTQRISVEQRQLLGLAASAALDPFALAEHHQIRVCTPADIPSLPPEHLAALTGGQSASWSAVSLRTTGRPTIVYNRNHLLVRINNSLAHEISHLLLDHSLGVIHPVGDAMMRDYSQGREDEADWLAGSLLLPEAALREAHGIGLGYERVAESHGTSVELARWRWNMCGLGKGAQPIRRSS